MIDYFNVYAPDSSSYNSFSLSISSPTSQIGRFSCAAYKQNKGMNLVIPLFFLLPDSRSVPYCQVFSSTPKSWWEMGGNEVWTRYGSFPFFYSSLQYPFVSVVRKQKILTFAMIISKLIVITYCESVFRKSFSENVEVFKTSRTIRTTLTFV